MILGVTGHRPKYYPEKATLEKPVNLWLEDLRHRVKDYLEFNRDNIDYIIDGMALGFDQLVVEIAIELGIPVYPYLPFKGQEYRWNKTDRFLYHQLLDLCMKPKYFSDKINKQAYKTRNQGIAGDCDKFICLYDEENAFESGTGQTVRMVTRLNKPIINFWR